MLRHRALLLGLIVALPISARAPEPASAQSAFVGPTGILLVHADSVAALRSKDWQTAATRNHEKLLRVSLRMRYWRDHLPPAMRRVYDELGYPTGRLLLTPVGHAEEWWYYGALGPPLRFRDGVLLDTDHFERLRSR